MLAATRDFLRRTTTAPGGADRARTDDPLLAKQVLSQLSYSPGPKVRGQKAEGRSQTRRIVSAFCPRTSDLNGGPR
jgi:hypothetical protein